MKKRILITMLLGLVILFALVACGKKDEVEQKKVLFKDETDMITTLTKEEKNNQSEVSEETRSDTVLRIEANLRDAAILAKSIKQHTEEERSQAENAVEKKSEIKDKYADMGELMTAAMKKYDEEKDNYKEHYEPKEILFFPWGKEEGKIGFSDSVQYDIDLYTNICLAESKNGDLYLLDGINKILYVYDNNYQLIKTQINFHVDEIKDMKMYDNVIYALTSRNTNNSNSIVAVREILKIIDNKVVLQYPIDEMSGREGWIRRRNPNTFHINDKKLIACDDWVGTIDKSFGIESIETIKDILILNGSEKIIYHKKDRKYIYESGNIQIPFEFPKSLYTSLPREILFWDDSGNSYYIFNSFTFSGSWDKYYEELVKLDKRGDIVTRIVINLEGRYDRHIHMTYYMKVTKNGNIYELCPKENGLKIIKWERK